jgi:predicted ATPase/DNA-binding winged helix-turn-helix (wHTH) protein
MKQFESFGLDTSNQCLWRHGEQIALPPKPFAVLRYLVENPGRLITHDELLDALWPETYVQPQVLRTYMLDLRKVLKDDAGQPRFIQTLTKRGYCFVAPVSDWDGPKRAGMERAVPERAGSERSAPEDHRVDSAHPPATAHDPQASNLQVSKIVARDEELARLKAQADLSASGQRRVVFITGEAGIGKTALVDEFIRQLAFSCSGSESGSSSSSDQPISVARGQCVEGFGRKEEYYPVMEALSQLCASPDGERSCKILTRMAPHWLAALGRESVPAAATPTQERMPGDLCAALEELAAEKPLILIFEDLHWADDSTLHLISALARRRAQAQLMVLATYRPRHGVWDGSGDRANSEANNRPRNDSTELQLKALKQDLLLRRLCAEVALAPLAKRAVSELLSKELKQQTLPPDLAGFVHQRSEGNPLFVIAILEHLIAQSFLVRNVTQWEQRVPLQEMEQEMEANVPDGLAQMIELEIERLSQPDQRLLEAGSLISVAFPAWAVAAALDEDPAEIEEACDELARRLYFVQRAGQDELPDGTRSAFYVFAHELYREVLYRRQTATRLARRHIRVAERLRELFAEREASVAREMAMHYEAAGDWRRAVQALRAAASHAQQRQADAEAAELLENALRIAKHLSETERSSAESEINSALIKAREALSEAAVR